MARKAKAEELVLVGGKKTQQRKASTKNWSKNIEDFLSALGSTVRQASAKAAMLAGSWSLGEPRGGFM